MMGPGHTYVWYLSLSPHHPPFPDSLLTLLFSDLMDLQIYSSMGRNSHKPNVKEQRFLGFLTTE